MADRDRINDGEMVKVVVPPGMSEEFFEAATAAGWSDDPGTGKSILTPDGSEIPNPQPMAPPIGYVAEDTLEDMVRRHMQKQINLLGMRGDDVIDESPEEADDFDIPDDLPDLRSIYEVVEMEPEFPGLPPSPNVTAALERAAEPAKSVEGEKGA